MLALDLERHQILHDAEIKRELGRPNALEVVDLSHALPTCSNLRPRRRKPMPRRRPAAGRACSAPLATRARTCKIVLRPMGAEGQDAIWSMGDDTPLAPFARVPRLVYAFFRQRFAQVTNPPIDPLRESLVMSLRTWLGPRPDLLQVDGPQTALIELASPIIDAGHAGGDSRRRPSCTVGRARTPRSTVETALARSNRRSRPCARGRIGGARRRRSC